MGSTASALPPPALLPPPADVSFEVWHQRTAEILRRGVTELDFRGQHIGAAGTAVVAQLLRSSLGASVTALHLSGNGVGDAGAACLADALAAGTSLRSLDLRSNCIGDEGAEYLSVALAGGSSLAWRNNLQELDLWFNCIGERGYATIATALDTNPSITWLRLDGHRPLIAAALAQNAEASRRMVVLTVHVTSVGHLSFTTLGGTELQTLSISLEELAAPNGFQPQREALAAAVGVKTARLRLAFPGGQLLELTDEKRALRELIEAALSPSKSLRDEDLEQHHAKT